MTAREFFVENWRGKLASLLVAVAIWYLIKSNLEDTGNDFPVPGTTELPTTRPPGPPAIDETILGPLAPPVPGNDSAE